MLWDLRNPATRQQLQQQANLDACDAIRAYWVPEHLTRRGQIVAAHFSTQIPGDLAAWADELTEDFMQNSIEIPRELLEALRIANVSGDTQLRAEAQARVIQYTALQQTARQRYREVCLETLVREFARYLAACHRLPTRTTPRLRHPDTISTVAIHIAHDHDHGISERDTDEMPRLRHEEGA